jgi:hypothetical protein
MPRRARITGMASRKFVETIPMSSRLGRGCTQVGGEEKQPRAPQFTLCGMTKTDDCGAKEFLHGLLVTG